jgi:hypothetical protein
VRRSPTETVNNGGGGKLEKNTSDIMLNIGGYDFHIECQVENDDTMAIRVFEYGFAYGRERKVVSEDKSIITVRMPDARIIYLEPTGTTPEEVTLRLVFPDGSEHDYCVKSYKLLEHSIEELEGSDLILLVPLYALKYRKALKAAEGAEGEKREETMRALAEDARRLIAGMEEAVKKSRERGVLGQVDALATMRHFDKMYQELYEVYPEFEEVRMELIERLRSHASEDFAAAEARGEARGVAKGEARGVAKGETRGSMLVINEVRRLRQQGMSLEQAFLRVQQQTMGGARGRIRHTRRVNRRRH